MTSPILQNLEKMLAGSRDNALLRFSLGNEYLKLGQAEVAATHFRKAVTFDPTYSAAWKLLGKSLEAAGRFHEALAAYQSGIAAAEEKGDIQASKEMMVFMRRLQKNLGSDNPDK